VRTALTRLEGRVAAVAGPGRFGGRALDRDFESRLQNGGKRRFMIDESLDDWRSALRLSCRRFLPPGVFPGLTARRCRISATQRPSWTAD